MLHRMAFGFYRVLLMLAGVAMVGAFVASCWASSPAWSAGTSPGWTPMPVTPSPRRCSWRCPHTLQHGEHIRVTLLLDRVPRCARAIEWWSSRWAWAWRWRCTWLVCGAAGLGVVRRLHDVSPSGDATPLWIPQLSMALGCVGFALAFAPTLLVARLSGGRSLREPGGERRARIEPPNAAEVPMDVLIASLLIVLLFVVLASGLWIGMALLGVAVVAMEVVHQPPGGRQHGAHDLGLAPRAGR